MTKIVLCVRESAAQEWLDGLKQALADRSVDAQLIWRDASITEVQASQPQATGK